MANHYEVRDFRAFADFIGDETHIQQCSAANVLLFAASHEIIENNLAAFLEDLPHFAGKVQVRFEAQGTRDIVKESSLDRDSVDDVLAEESPVKLLGDPDGIIERRPGMLGAVERNKDVFDHASLRIFGSREDSLKHEAAGMPESRASGQ